MQSSLIIEFVTFDPSRARPGANRFYAAPPPSHAAGLPLSGELPGQSFGEAEGQLACEPLQKLPTQFLLAAKIDETYHFHSRVGQIKVRG